MTIEEKTARAESLYNAGRLEEAEQLLMEALQDAPASVQALNDMGVIAYAKGNIEQAAEYFLRALRIDPSFEDGFVNLLHLAGQEKIPLILLPALEFRWQESAPDGTPTREEVEALEMIVSATVEKFLLEGSVVRISCSFPQQLRHILNRKTTAHQRQGMTPGMQFLRALRQIWMEKDLETGRNLLEKADLPAGPLREMRGLLLAALHWKAGDAATAVRLAKEVRVEGALRQNARALLNRCRLHSPALVPTKKKVLVLIDHRGILKLFVNMLVCTPELLQEFDFHFSVSDFYRRAEMFGPADELKTLEALNRLTVSYDYWDFTRFIDNGIPGKRVVADRLELWRRYPELVPPAVHQFCLRYEPDRFDLIITGLRSLTLVPMLRAAGYRGPIILYPVAPFIYYPGFREVDNTAVRNLARHFTDGCFHVVAGPFFEDMYEASFPGHPFRVVNIPHGVNPDFYPDWKGDRPKIFWAAAGLMDPDNDLYLLKNYLEERGFALEVFGYSVYRNVSKNCSPEGAPEVALREAMRHCQAAVQFFISHQMIGYVEKLAAGIPTVSILSSPLLMGKTEFSKRYRAECDFVDRENVIAIKLDEDFAAQLCMQLQRLLSDDEYRAAVSERQYRAGLERYGFERYQRQWSRLIRQACELKHDERKCAAPAAIGA